jgi:hypothetical protein
VLRNRLLIVFGYSGSDDFDLTPLLLETQPSAMVWFNYEAKAETRFVAPDFLPARVRRFAGLPGATFVQGDLAMFVQELKELYGLSIGRTKDQSDIYTVADYVRELYRSGEAREELLNILLGHFGQFDVITSRDASIRSPLLDAQRVQALYAQGGRRPCPGSSASLLPRRAEGVRLEIAKANEAAAIAQQRAAEATERTQALEKEAAEAQIRQENAEHLLSEVSKRQGPRRLDMQSLKRAMAGKPKGKCQIVYWPNDREALAFAQQFQRWLGPGIDGDGLGWEVQIGTPSGGWPASSRHRKAPPVSRWGLLSSDLGSCPCYDER